MEALLTEVGVVKSFRLRQGCVIERMDESRFQLRNFRKGEAWMREKPFENIRRVYRSPLAYLRSKKPVTLD